MKEKRNLSVEKQIERIQKQIEKFGDPKKNKDDPYGPKQQIINELKEAIK